MIAFFIGLFFLMLIFWALLSIIGIAHNAKVSRRLAAKQLEELRKIRKPTKQYKDYKGFWDWLNG